MRKLIAIAAVGLTVLVSACGGGNGGSSSSGGGSSSSSTSSAPPDYSSNAAAAKLSATVTTDTTTSFQSATLGWTDTFPAGTSYVIKAQNSDGSYTSSAMVTGTGGAMTWASPGTLTANTTFQIQATVGSMIYTLQTAEGATSVIADYFPSGQLTLGAVSDEISTRPAYVKGNTTFKIYGSSTAFSAVNWSVDGTAIGAGAVAVNNAVTWNSATTSYDRTIKATADILASPSSHVLLTQLFTTHNTPLLFGTDTVASDNTAHVYVESPLAAETYSGSIPTGFDVKMGVTSIAIDGTTVASLPAPNNCYHHISCSLGSIGFSYLFSYNADLTQGAQHTVMFTATDQAGNTGQFRTTFTSPYTISTVLTTPVNNAVVSGTLHYAGTTTDLEPGGPLSTAILFGRCVGVAEGDKLVAQPTGSSFSGDFDLTGYAPGTYELCAIGYMQNRTASTKSIVQVTVQ